MTKQTIKQFLENSTNLNTITTEEKYYLDSDSFVRILTNSDDNNRCLLRVTQGTHNDRVNSCVSKDALIESDFNKVLIESNGRKLFFNTTKSPIHTNFSGCLRDLLNTVVRDNSVDLLEKKAASIRVYKNYEIVANDIWDESDKSSAWEYSLGLIDPFLEYEEEQVKKYFFSEDEEGMVNFDIFLYNDYNSNQKPMSSELRFFIRNNFTENESGTFTSKNYPYLKAYKTDNGYRLSVSSGGDYIEGFRNDNIWIGSGMICLSFGDEMYCIFI